MNRIQPVSPTYADCVGGHRGALAGRAQWQLRESTVMVVGAGGLGIQACMGLAAAGVGTLVVVDPQRLEPTDLNRQLHAGSRDLGRFKAEVAAAFLGRRPHLCVLPIVDRAESATVEEVARGADLLIGTCNTIAGRKTVARLAVQRHIGHVAAAAHDARRRLGGMVTTWTPLRADLACPACLLPDVEPARGEALFPSVLMSIGGVLVHEAVRILAGTTAPDDPNLIEIDFEEGLNCLRVLRRPTCDVCQWHQGAGA